MDLSKLCSCLDNSAQIDGVINKTEQVNSEIKSRNQINSDFSGFTRVFVKYTAGYSDNIDVVVDDQNKSISATIKEIQFDSADDFPEIGSDRLIYIDKSQDTPYRFDTATGTYKSIGKDLTAEFNALDKKIDDVAKQAIKDIIVNEESSVAEENEERISRINIAIQQDAQNNLLYYLMVNGRQAGEINVPKDQFLKSASYDPDSNELIFVWETTAGENTTRIDMSDLVDAYTAGDGLQIEDNKFSIKVDPTSSGMLTVSENGIKLTLEPATKKTFGVVRAWVEDDYICISTEEYVPFVNTKIDKTLYIEGSYNAIQQGNTLIIN